MVVVHIIASHEIIIQKHMSADLPVVSLIRPIVSFDWDK